MDIFETWIWFPLLTYSKEANLLFYGNNITNMKALWIQRTNNLSNSSSYCSDSDEDIDIEAESPKRTKVPYSLTLYNK